MTDRIVRSDPVVSRFAHLELVEGGRAANATRDFPALALVSEVIAANSRDITIDAETEARYALDFFSALLGLPEPRYGTTEESIAA